ncbi:MAG: DUF2203 domain-containing protein [Thaumarchaeota archaeon]|nr:DUF2203 domain-containing protein [Nitrososphaerota archaeon]
MVHYFTPEEANKILPDVSSLVSRIVELKGKLDTSTGKDRREIMDELTVCVSKIEQLGIEVKDLDSGLIDFPAMRFHEMVYLCWKLGEGEVLYWHGVSEGFKGRKLLKPEAAQIR